MAQTFRGRAQVEGVTNAIDVIIRKTVQRMGLTQEFDEQINLDEHGNDCAWKANNEKYMGELELTLVATDTSTRAQVATAAAFLAAYAVITISTCEVTAWNTTYQNISGASINLENVAAGKMSFRVRRYADSTQNTLAATIPT